jgi:hypothetical protein
MNRQNISIATISLIRDEQEEQLLRSSLTQLAALDIPVFITDGGSPAGFLDFVASFPHFTILHARGLWAQAKNSIMHAHQSASPFILYTEPDKLDFFQKGLPDMLDQATVDAHTGVLLASRSDTGFATFPSFQQMTETTINNCLAEITGKAFDYTYGPFLLNRQLVPYLNLIHEDIGWGWRPFAFGIAHRLGLTVKAFTGHFFCPADQREDDAKERIYRMRQLTQNIQGLVQSANMTLPDTQLLP